MKHVFVVMQIAQNYEADTNYLDSVWSSKELADKRVAEIDKEDNRGAEEMIRQGWRVSREHVPSVIAMEIDASRLIDGEVL